MNDVLDVKISVIIPVYNTAKYLKRCLDSVINQSYQNLEILCINDCSTDNSLKILEEYAQKDSRIKVINNPVNCGVAKTRNYGIEIAKGEYIHFVDSDDRIEPYLYENMQKTIEEYNPEIIHFLHKVIKVKNNKEFMESVPIANPQNYYNEIIKPRDFVEYFDNVPVIWDKIFQKEFLEKYKFEFPDLKCNEDTIFVWATAVKAEKYIIVDKSYYCYSLGVNNSITAMEFKNFSSKFKVFELIKKMDAPPEISNKLMTRALLRTKKKFDEFVLKSPIMAKKYFKDLQVLCKENSDFTKDNSITRMYKFLVNDTYWQYYIKLTLKRYFPRINQLLVRLLKGGKGDR